MKMNAADKPWYGTLVFSSMFWISSWLLFCKNNPAVFLEHENRHQVSWFIATTLPAVHEVVEVK